MSDNRMDKEINDYLQSYTVDYPQDEVMESSINYIMSQVAPMESLQSKYIRKVKTLASISVQEFLQFGWVFWSLNSLFLLFGLLSLLQSDNNPYLTLFALAPLPFLVGIYEIFKSRDEGMMELELSFRFHMHQILTSRLLVVGVYNFVINLMISGVCLMVIPDLELPRLLISWTVPFVVVTGVAFIFATYIKSTLASGVLVAVWFAFCFGMVQLLNTKHWFTQLSNGMACGLLVAGILLWIVHVVRINKQEWGKWYGEINH